MLEENSPNKVKDWLLSQCKEAEAVTEIPSLEFDEQEGAILECGIEHIVSPSLFYINLTDKKYKGYRTVFKDRPFEEKLGRSDEFMCMNFLQKDLKAT